MADKRPQYGAGRALDEKDRVLWKEIEPGVFALAGYVADGVVNLGDSSAVMLRDENGVSFGMKQIDNKIRVSAMPYLYDIAEGNVPNHEPFRSVGYNPSVGTSWETVHVSSTIRNYLTTAERLQIVSSDADDDGAPVGAGARTVKVVGLDADWKQYEETVTMNGTTNVTTTNAFIRVFYMQVLTAGATGYNEGTISAKNTAGAVTLDAMAVGQNRSHSAAYTVPVGHTAYLIDFTAFEASSKGSRFGGWVREFGGVWHLERQIVLLDSGTPVPVPMPMRIPAKADMEMRAIAILAGAIVTASFEGWIEHD